jgi:hypothetical protein
MQFVLENFNAVCLDPGEGRSQCLVPDGDAIDAWFRKTESVAGGNAPGA